MKHLNIFVAIMLLCSSASFAQIVQCDTMGVAYIADSIVFKKAMLVTPDSSIIIPMVNNTQTNFAYPQARLENVTPLPTGMSIYNAGGWYVFASAWNVGDTMPASIDYYVNNPIPDNYTVTFNLYVKNFAPLTIDSCVFINALTINLKPVSTSAVHDMNAGDDSFSFDPNPATNNITVKPGVSKAVIEIYSLTGALIQTVTADHSMSADISGLAPGIYFVKEKGKAAVQKLVKI